MERFAIVGGQDQVHRYIKNHPLLRLLPTSLAKSIIPKAKSRFTNILYKKDSEEELGYVLYVPGFFVGEDKCADLDRTKVIDNLVYELQNKDIRILVFPLWREFLTVEERDYIEGNSIILLDGGLIRLVSLMDTIERLFAILKTKLHELEVGIWGADSIVGQLWVEFLSPSLNNLIIGGSNLKELERLSNKILYKTGLSSQITLDINQCLNNKSIAILCSIPEDSIPEDSILEDSIFEGGDRPNHSRIMVLSYYGSEYGRLIYQNWNAGSIYIESGLPSIPDELKISSTLNPWDEIGSLEAVLFIMDESFRNLLLNSSLNMENINKIKEVFVKYGIGSTGMISNDDVLSYNGFRKRYFEKKIP